jgi:hypothetical protein
MVMTDVVEGKRTAQPKWSLDVPPHDELDAYDCERGALRLSSPLLFPLRPETDVSYTTLDLSPVRSGCSVTAIDSPEAKSMLACFERRGDRLVLTPGRLHLGARRRLDTATAILQMMSLDSFAKAVAPYGSDETVVVSILREGPILRAQENLFMATGLDAKDHVVISVHHVPDRDGHKGLKAEANYYRTDLPKEAALRIKQAIVADSVAGGRNLIETLKIIGQDLPNLEQVLVVAIHASLKGMERVARHAAPHVEKFRFFCLNGAITASAINHYDCYLPRHRPDTLPDPNDILLFDTIYGEHAPWIPIGGDWSANHLNPTRATEVFAEQLDGLGLTIDGVVDKLSGITPEDMVEAGFRLEDLMPYSTLLGLQDKETALR